MSEPWKCIGCGKSSPERKRVCDCPSSIVYYRDEAENTVTGWKVDPNDEPELTHADLCRLSRVFNMTANLGDSQDAKINEWLKLRIAEVAKAAGGRHIKGVFDARACMRR